MPSPSNRVGGPWAAVMALLVLAGCAGAPVQGEGDTASVTPPPLEVVWRRSLTEVPGRPYEPRERAQPAWDAERRRIFAANRLGAVHALTADGELVWTRSLGGEVSAGLLATAGRLFVASTEGRVHSLDPDTGETQWTYAAETEIVTRPTHAGDLLLFTTAANTLIALDAATGEFRWLHRRPAPSGLSIHGTAGVTVADGRAFTGFSDGTVDAVGLSDGKVLWSRTFGGSGDFVDVDTTPVVHGGRVYVASYGGGIHALEAATGQPVWTTDALASANAQARVGELLVVVAPGRAAAFRLSDGRQAWSTDIGGGSPSQPVVHEGRVLVSTEEGPLHVLDGRTGRPSAAFDPGKGVTAAPVATRNAIWAFSNGGVLYRLAWR